jgi:hypothetical protein
MPQGSVGHQFLGSKLAVEHLKRDHEVLLRALYSSDKIETLARTPRDSDFSEDFVDLVELESFKPDVVIVEATLLEFQGPRWKLPELWLDAFIRRGGVLLVDGMHSVNLDGVDPEVRRELFRFLDIRPAGADTTSLRMPYLEMVGLNGNEYVRDHHSRSVVSVGPKRAGKVIGVATELVNQIWDEVGEVFLVGAMPLESFGPAGRFSIDIGEVEGMTAMIDDQWIGNPRQVDRHVWAKATQIGNGYQVVIAGTLLLDSSVQQFDGNLRYLDGILRVLCGESRRNAGIRAQGESTTRSVHFGIDEVTDVKKLIQDGEGLKVEFKSAATISDENQMEIIKNIAAFANTSGGVILVGVRDDGSLCGVDDELARFTEADPRDGFKRRINSKVKNCIEASLVSVQYETKFVDCEGRKIAAIFVRESLGPVYVRVKERSEVFVRRDAETARLDAREIGDFLRSKNR